jgi:outer membrane protein assembly factor BamB
MKRLHVKAAVLFTVFLSVLVLAPFAGADWYAYRADSAHSGVGTGSALSTPTLLWTYSTMGPIKSSPAVVDGIVYVDAWFTFYALNAANGIQIWNYTTGVSVESSPASC